MLTRLLDVLEEERGPHTVVSLARELGCGPELVVTMLQHAAREGMLGEASGLRTGRVGCNTAACGASSQACRRCPLSV